MNFVGRRVPLVDGAAKAAGRLPFVADRPGTSALHGAVVFSPYAHARIVSVDASAALALDGVFGAHWHANTPGNRYNSSIWHIDQQALADERMFPAVVRHIGDRVAAIVAETEEIARRAAARASRPSTIRSQRNASTSATPTRASPWRKRSSRSGYRRRAATTAPSRPMPASPSRSPTGAS
jgi:xanthine dehydrogenase molybdopterin-binding subunit B